MSTVLAAAPALPLHKAGPYVAAAYIVFVVLLLVYLGIMGLRTKRTERAVEELREEARRRNDDSRHSQDAPETGASAGGERDVERDVEVVGREGNREAVL